MTSLRPRLNARGLLMSRQAGQEQAHNVKKEGGKEAIKFTADETIELIPSLTKMVQSDFDKANDAVLDAAKEQQATQDQLDRQDMAASLLVGGTRHSAGASNPSLPARRDSDAVLASTYQRALPARLMT